MSAPAQVGIVMLVHTAFDRAEQVIRHWVKGGCPVVVHVDSAVNKPTYDDFVRALADVPEVSFSKRHRCEWGSWGLVAATQDATQQMLDFNPDVTHVYLASGSCMPLRPVAELRTYLADHPGTDFIESATTADVPWTVGGLDQERFTLRFPFSWRRQRRLFDGYVRLQRRLGFKRKVPTGLIPHMGSQWWCLTRSTASAILNDPDRATYDRYFRRVWIPDESYFQTLARLYSSKIESRSLTLSKFDFQGKPHSFYDDHLPLLRRSDCFVARKIWPHADRLYATFLGDATDLRAAEPNPGRIDRLFSRAQQRRTRGRRGLYMQSRFPNRDWENGVTAERYTVFEGFDVLFPNWEGWLTQMTEARVHGHLFAPDRVEFAAGQSSFAGALSESAALRDYNPQSFLRSLLWNTRGERQIFQFGPHDDQSMSWELVKDPNAQIVAISGAWALPLFQSGRDFRALRAQAATLQKVERDHLDILRSIHAKARVTVWTLAEFLDDPRAGLQSVLEDIAGRDSPRIATLPEMVDLSGFGAFLQRLKNEGMHPYLMGDFATELAAPRVEQAPTRKRYVVR